MGVDVDGARSLVKYADSWQRRFDASTVHMTLKTTRYRGRLCCCDIASDHDMPFCPVCLGPAEERNG